ncbi:MAG: NAD(+) diphosphatase [Thermomicrobiales bacterium]
MHHAFVPATAPPADVALDGDVLWFAFREGEVLVVDGEAVAIPCATDLTAAGSTVDCCHYLGALGGRHCYAVHLPAAFEPPPGMRLSGLRPLFGAVPDELFGLAGRAAQIVAWDRDHRFCGRCGGPTDDHPRERAKRCPACGLLQFPRLSPAVITLVERDGNVLLARGPHFAPGMYSALAGFVEPGESLEEAVAREIDEEVGISVADIRYVGSQPWPFPHSLMIGFTAVYAGGEIRMDEREIVDAGWFTPDTLPGLPGTISIARRLIDAYLAKHGALSGDA